MKFIATQRGYFGDRIIEPGQEFEASKKDLTATRTVFVDGEEKTVKELCSWAEPVKKAKAEPEPEPEK